MPKWDESSKCFACGADNPAGLHLEFDITGENTIKCKYIAQENHEGYAGVLHGGITAALLELKLQIFTMGEITTAVHSQIYLSQTVQSQSADTAGAASAMESKGAALRSTQI